MHLIVFKYTLGNICEVFIMLTGEHFYYKLPL